MSREVRRVPLDFDWPVGTTWGGYLMPESLQEESCEPCGGTGTTSAQRWVVACAHMLLMLDDDLEAQARGQQMHPYFNDFYTTAYGTRPSPDIREFGTGLAGREASFLGHDALDGWAATKKIIRAAGLDPETWGRCLVCDGHGSAERYEGQRAEAEQWRRTDPPTGAGWQLWETVSEGSPVSPVFGSSDELAYWMAATGRAADYATAQRFVAAGWAPSGAFSAAGHQSGVDFVGGAQ